MAQPALVATSHIRTSYATQEGVWRVEVGGTPDATTSGRLAVALGRLAPAGRPVVVDLSRARVVAGSLISALALATVELEAAGSTLRVVLAPPRSNHELLRLPTGLPEYASYEEALASITAPSAGRPRWKMHLRRVG